MRLVYFFATAVLLTMLLPVLHASAFTTGSAMATPDSSSGFVDPDEQVHSFFFGNSGVSEDGWADRNSVSRNVSAAPDARPIKWVHSPTCSFRQCRVANFPGTRVSGAILWSGAIIT